MNTLDRGSTADAAPGAPVTLISVLRRRALAPGPIGWAAFLASSWTWCIGMFLPVLMLRDYGPWGWVVFGLPNVVGAAAMGWMLLDADASSRLQADHLAACRWFSIVTLAFHAYFALALAPALLGDGFIVLCVALLPVVALLWGRRGRRATVAGGAALAVSLLAMLGVLALLGLPHLPPPQRQRVDLLWLAPVSAFGFILGPYLDLTFHRARQSTTRAGGRTAFGLGFGAFFLSMILFTAVYTPALLPRLWDGPPMSIREPLAAVLATHLAVQTAFTVVAHADALALLRPATAAGWARRGMGVVAIIAGALALRWLQGRFPVYRGLWGNTLGTPELIYRLFMAFYGLVFPTYVWLFMVPRFRRRRRRAGLPPGRAWVYFFIAVLALAAPGFWLGFIEGRMVLLVPALLLVLAARVVLPKPAAAAAPLE